LKILIGGSPCTHWSVAQKKNRETQPNSGLGWELFLNYKIALEKYKPDYFLYENNKSASQAIKDEIAKELCVVEPDLFTPDNGHRMTYINSALVSAQHRERFYVTNFGDIEIPQDRGILLRDVLDGITDRDKARTVLSSIGRTTTREYFAKSQNTMVYEPVNPLLSGKARCATAGYANKSAAHILESNYSDNPHKQKWDSVCEPVRIGAMPRPNGEISKSQGFRIYDIDGKSVGIKGNSGCAGGKTGLYAIPLNTKNGKSQTIKAQSQQTNEDNIITYAGSTFGASGVAERVPIYAIPCEWDEFGRPTKAISGSDGKVYRVHEVKNGLINIKGKPYPINLPDGFYIIRKLTVRECMRLQTIPDWYEFPVSDSQAYKMIGNGWTIEVIKHLLSHIPNIRNEEIEVLSMYDGMSCGQIALKEMGCNVAKYYATEIDKFAIQTTQHNFPSTIQLGDAFQVRDSGWHL
jgi:DNA (cytosine-5)-methyltransferase 3A